MSSSYRPVFSMPSAALPVLLSLMFAIAPTTVRAKDEAAPTPKAIPAELQAAVTRAEFLGRQIYLHDRAAWLATDAMLADKRMKALKERVGGWVTEPTAHGIRVIFISKDETPVRLYQIEMDEREALSEAVLESPEPLAPEHHAQLRARALAGSQSFMMCSKQYNVVTMPSAEGIRVYMMPSFPAHGVYPLGGYHLYETDSTGEKILASRKFSNGCIEHRDVAPGQPKDATSAFGMFTHLLDLQPTEVHVFVSLYAKVPMMILSVDNKLTWTVIKGKIAFLDKMD